MPYPRAYLWVTLLLLLTIPAFWPSYLGRLGGVEWQLHVHGTTAGLWLLLLIWQSWSIHHGRRAAHRSTGLAVLLLTPVFLAGGILVIGTIAGRAGPFPDLFAAPLVLIDLISAFAFAGLIYTALRYRSQVALHSSAMLATVLLLINPVVARVLMNYAPGLTIRSIEELPRFSTSIHIAQGFAMAIALFLFLRHRRHGRPWLVLAIVLAVQSALYQTVGFGAWWRGIADLIVAVEPALLASFGIALGGVVVAAGWTAGSESLPRAA